MKRFKFYLCTIWRTSLSHLRSLSFDNDLIFYVIARNLIMKFKRNSIDVSVLTDIIFTNFPLLSILNVFTDERCKSQLLSWKNHDNSELSWEKKINQYTTNAINRKLTTKKYEKLICCSSFSLKRWNTAIILSR